MYIVDVFQLEYGAEKNKILQGNAEGYKKELASLREKEKKLFTSVAKHEQTINTLRQVRKSCSRLHNFKGMLRVHQSNSRSTILLFR